MELSTALLTVACVFSGCALWWLALTLTIAGVHHALGVRVRKRNDQLSGLALAALGGFEMRPRVN